MQQLGKSPLRRINPAAPFNGFQLFAMRQFRDLRRFLLGPVVAPQVILVQWPHLIVDRDNAGAGSIQCNGLHLVTRNARGGHSFARRVRQRSHVIFVGLCREFRIFALAVQGILGNRGRQNPSFAVYDGDAHAERAEIHSCHNRHGLLPHVRQYNAAAPLDHFFTCP